MIQKKPKKEPRIPKEKPPKKRSAKSLMTEADNLARAFCKREGCCAARGYQFTCSGRLEWAHLKSRKLKYIRHDPLNCLPLCWAHHDYFTAHPDLWTGFVAVTFPDRWQRLNDLLIEQRQKRLKPDYLYWIDFYKKRAA